MFVALFLKGLDLRHNDPFAVRASYRSLNETSLFYNVVLS
jgi:hypothetical protein